MKSQEGAQRGAQLKLVSPCQTYISLVSCRSLDFFFGLVSASNQKSGHMDIFLFILNIRRHKNQITFNYTFNE